MSTKDASQCVCSGPTDHGLSLFPAFPLSLRKPSAQLLCCRRPGSVSGLRCPVSSSWAWSRVTLWGGPWSYLCQNTAVTAAAGSSSWGVGRTVVGRPFLRAECCLQAPGSLAGWVPWDLCGAEEEPCGPGQQRCGWSQSSGLLTAELCLLSAPQRCCKCQRSHQGIQPRTSRGQPAGQVALWSQGGRVCAGSLLGSHP